MQPQTNESEHAGLNLWNSLPHLWFVVRWTYTTHCHRPSLSCQDFVLSSVPSVVVILGMLFTHNTHTQAHTKWHTHFHRSTPVQCKTYSPWPLRRTLQMHSSWRIESFRSHVDQDPSLIHCQEPPSRHSASLIASSRWMNPLATPQETVDADEQTVYMYLQPLHCRTGLAMNNGTCHKSLLLVAVTRRT